MGCASVRCEELNGGDEEIEGSGLYFLCFYGPGYVNTSVMNTDLIVTLSIAFYEILVFMISLSVSHAHRGNYYGEPPYQTGNEPCSNCPYEKPFCEDMLCGEL